MIERTGEEIMSSDDAATFLFLAENSIDIICRAGLDMVLHYVSPSSFYVLGWKPEEMTGKRPDAFFLPEDASALADNSVAIVRMRMKDGMMAWVEIKHRMVCESATGVPRENIIVIRDITERKTLEERLSVFELTDARTGLFTALAFNEALEREWNRTLREGSFISLLLLDFDHFRQFHDWREHLEGDRCLAKAAANVLGVLRVTDFAARYGAEAIAIILPSTGPRGATRVAAKLRSAIEPLRSPLNVKLEGRGWVTVNIGISTVLARAGGTSRMPEILLLAADCALHRAMHQESESQAMASPISPILRDRP
jgi:diguanylate cyclase (GGDEF)-like protein/PAS domain S-box-containing protein